MEYHLCADIQFFWQPVRRIPFDEAGLAVTPVTRLPARITENAFTHFILKSSKFV
jgi:hypothetical protein